MKHLVSINRHHLTRGAVFNVNTPVARWRHRQDIFHPGCQIIRRGHKRRLRLVEVHRNGQDRTHRQVGQIYTAVIDHNRIQWRIKLNRQLRQRIAGAHSIGVGRPRQQADALAPQHIKPTQARQAHFRAAHPVILKDPRAEIVGIVQQQPLNFVVRRVVWVVGDGISPPGVIHLGDDKHMVIPDSLGIGV